MKSVVLCGSRRFKPQIRKFAQELKKKGATVLELCLRRGDENQRTPTKSKFLKMPLRKST